MFDAYVQFWLDAGMQGIFSEGVAYMNGGDVYVMTIERDGSGNTILKERIAGSTAANAFLQQYLQALRSHLEAKGWLGKFYMQIADETLAADRAEWLQIAYLVPTDVKILDTFYVSAGVNVYAGLIDVWVPWIDVYEANQASRDYYDKRQSVNGDKKWFYTFGEDAADRVNRLIDGPAYKSRLVFWYAALRNMDGYLHWGYNWWSPKDTYHGDAWLVYPDAATKGVKTTIREQNQRDGVEELEVFRLLKARDPARALDIVDNVITGHRNHSHEIGALKANRELLLNVTASALSCRCP